MRMIFSLLLTLAGTTASPSNEVAFKALGKYAVKHGVTEKNLKTGLTKVIWKKDKSALAVCFVRAKKTLCLVAYKTDQGFSISDVSLVEGANFGFFGFQRSHYDRFITEPTDWREDGGFSFTNFKGKGRHEVHFRTRAWRAGQRYTAGEPVVLDVDWKPLWR